MEFGNISLYKDAQNDNIATLEQQSSLQDGIEDQNSQSIAIFLHLLQESKTNFQNQDLDNTKKNFIDILNLMNKGFLSDVNSEIIIQYTKDLISIVEQLEKDSTQQQTIFYALKIILHFFYMADNDIMNSIIQSGYLPFFHNLINFPEVHVKEIVVFIISLFFSSDDFFAITMNSSLFSDICDIFQSYLKIENLSESLHILMAISNAFNDIAKRYYVNEYITSGIIEKIFELYSASFQNNYETMLIQRFIDLIQILKSKKDSNIISLLFKFNIPFIFYQILLHSESHKNQSLFLFAYLITNIDETGFSALKTFFDFQSFIDLLIKSNGSPSFNLNYAFLILANSARFDDNLDLLNMISSDIFLSFIQKFLNDSDFNVKYNANQCLFSALCASSVKSIQLVSKFFKSDIMILALDIIECGISELIIQILNSLDCTFSRLEGLPNTKEMPYYEAFEEKFYQLIEELQNSSDEDVKTRAYEIQIKYCLVVL